MPGRLQEWNVYEHVDGRTLVECTFLECVINESSDICIDVVVHAIDGTMLGSCRSDARISHGFSRLLWEE